MDAEPISLAEYLAAGYRFQMHGGQDPAPSCARAVPWGELVAEQARLGQIAGEGRTKDHISQVKLRFVKRCLDLAERKP